MPLSIPDALIAELNAENNSLVWLYRVSVSDDPTDDYFFAGWNEDISYFKDESTPQVYTAMGIKHKGLSQNSRGQIDPFVIQVGNLDKNMSYQLLTRDGLRGRKVVIRQVSMDLLVDSTAHVEATFYIGSAVTRGTTAEITLTSKADILDLRLPRRKFYRDHCPFPYKKEGCWYESGVLSEHTVKSEDFPTYAQAALIFPEKNCTGLVMDATCSLTIDLKVDDPDDFDLSNSSIEIASDRNALAENWAVMDIGSLLDVKGEQIDDSWRRFIIPLDEFIDSTPSTPLVVSEIDYLRFFMYFISGEVTSSKIYWRRASVSWPSMEDYTAPEGFQATMAPLSLREETGLRQLSLYEGYQSMTQSRTPRRVSAKFQPKNFWDLEKASGALIIDIECDLPARLEAGKSSQIEISSSYAYDTNEWNLPDLKNIHLVDVGGKNITNAMQTFELPLSAFVEQGGAPDVTALNRLEMYYRAGNSGQFTIAFRNAKLQFAAGVSMAEARFAPKDFTGLSKASEYLYIDLKSNNAADMDALGNLGITSSGTYDSEEWRYSDLTGDLPLAAGGVEPIGAAYKTFKIPLSDFTNFGGGVDVSNISYIYWCQGSVSGNDIVCSWQNAYLSIADSCLRIQRNCRQHNNNPRFGGFPGVPTRRIYRQ